MKQCVNPTLRVEHFYKSGKMSWRGFDVWKTSSVGSYDGVVDSSSLAFHRCDGEAFSLYNSPGCCINGARVWQESAGQATSF